ncbi:EVE domain-containing protein [Candidatus Phycosocius spiralis]|uniref:Ubiquinol-cytochrome c reductase n=1 Tax=Candidatus Phycosocius spiralis TaxID=2815099 RepID=A0ABQ4PYL1_9PROT|nr:EVE domain-containing protein [Candidatus Phycosocius spiralis]GIU67749.1 ubiquinol-cytochrome c reductase [Candidatus Phycosocius spiralis]
MQYWLLKSEPDQFSFDQQVKCGPKGEAWTGVRNHQAKNYLKAMAKGDLALFYHTGDERQIVGVVEIIKPAYPDPTDPTWVAVDVAAVKTLNKPIGLGAIKADPRLADLALVKAPRLSVQPVSADHWEILMAYR